MVFWGLLLAVSLLSAGETTAQVTVSNVIMTFQMGKRPVQNVMVGNSSEHPAYVLATVERVLDPAEGGSKSEPTEDIIVSPKAFSIEPRGSRAVRLLVKSPPKGNEEVYRVVFTPQDREFGTEIKKDFGGRTATIRVLTGMGVLVFVEPANPMGNLEWQRDKEAIVFANSGNVHVELGEGKSCKGTACNPVDRKRVYPGSTYQVKVAPENQLTFLARSGSAGAYENLTIEPLKDADSVGRFSPGAGR